MLVDVMNKRCNNASDQCAKKKKQDIFIIEINHVTPLKKEPVSCLRRIESGNP